MVVNMFLLFCVDYVGSLLWLVWLFEVWVKKVAGEFDADVLRVVEDDCVVGVVAL